MIGAFTAILVAVVAILVYFSEQRAYKVHTEGIVLVTGASSGIGQHAAEYLADHHSFLVLAGVRKQKDFDAITKLNKKNLLPLLIDVSSHESCSAAVLEIKKVSEARKLPIVGLVNNAGIGGFNPLEYQDLNAARRLFDTNVFGLLDITQQLLPMLRVNQGRVVMLSSIAGFMSAPFSGVYSASKFAVEALSDALRRELQAHGVSVSIVQPGYVRTQIIATQIQASEAEFDAKKEAELLALYPGAAKRAGMAEMMLKQPGPDATTTPAIAHALVSAFPKTRYPVAGAEGMSATFISWLLWALSDRLKDVMSQN